MSPGRVPRAGAAKRAPIDASILTADDLYLFNEGSHLRLWEKLGAHPTALGGRPGTRFAVWAPNAARVSVVGSFNGWDPRLTPLAPRGNSGLWSGFAPDVISGALYKYHVVTRGGRLRADKGDPCGFYFEEAPNTFDEPLIALGSRDRQWTVALWFERAAWASANAGDSRACFHLFPLFGRIKPGGSATVRGAFYLLRGSPPDLHRAHPWAAKL